MGLDMYLTAKRYIWSHRKEDQKIKVVGANIPKGFELKEISVRAAYWRKENAIHKWFVENVQENEDDCKEYFVEVSKLKELLALVTAALKNKDSGELPTQEGFFFGGTDYDEWYWEGLKGTKEILTKILKEFNEKDWEFYYRSSW